MGAKNRDEFIKELAGSHRPVKPMLSPGVRSLVWSVSVLVVTTVVMVVRQPFRPGFGQQLIDHPAMTIEVVSALVVTFLGSYAAFVNVVPGGRVPRWAATTLWVCGVLFAAGIAAEFTHLAPESSTLGARPNCWAEVLVYGIAGTIIFVRLAMRGWVRFSWTVGLGYGVASIVPAALMQVACMYEPVHNVLFHYLPIIPVIAVGLFLMKRASDRASRK